MEEPFEKEVTNRYLQHKYEMPDDFVRELRDTFTDFCAKADIPYNESEFFSAAKEFFLDGTYSYFNTWLHKVFAKRYQIDILEESR